MAIDLNINRRQFLCYGAANLISGYTSTLTGTGLVNNEQATFNLSASSNNIGEYFLTATDNKNRILYQHQLPFRGHAFAISYRHQRIFCISRRPENVISIFNLQGKLLQQLETSVERHLYGHAICDNNGTHLYTTENNIGDGSGKISVWSIGDQTTRINTLPSYGVGPHDIALSPDQQYIIVANGGVRTHPHSGRKKLNIATMSPSLVFIDRASGKLHKKLQLPPSYRHNSIRHLATDRQGNVFIALQNQLPEHTHEILLARYDKVRDTLIPFDIPRDIAPRLQGYMGSIILDHSHTILAATSPRGNCALFYTINGKFLYHLNSDDVCGIRANENAGEFIFSNGKGELIHCFAGKTLVILSVNHHPHTYWDNHITRL
jgi:hypothetical protein